MELQKVQPELASRGIGLIAISYDRPQVLRDFAAAKGIGFPLLADEGCRVITRLGLLDRDLAAHHDAFGVPTRDDQFGVAYPAVFVLDEAGRVVERRIRENYRAREGGPKLLAEALGLALPPAGAEQRAGRSRLAVTVAADGPGYVRWQEARLRLFFEVEPGWHVYGRPISEGYVPLEVEVQAPPEVVVGPAAYPPARHFRVLDEEFHVHEGGFEVRVPFAVDVAAGHGPVDLQVGVRYQACSDSECLPPYTLTVDLRLEEAPPA